jgi:hypothetical protein
MANRTYNQFGGTLERKVIKLFAKITYSGGAPSLVLSEVLNSSTSPVTINPSQGFVSLTDLGNGDFTLTLGASNGGVPTYDPYVRLLNVSMSAVPGGTAAAPIALWVINDNVNGSSGNPSITFTTVTVGGSPLALSVSTVPDNGTVMYVELTLSNTTAY